MACDHRYQVTVDDDKGTVRCKRCGDIRIDGLQVGQTEDDIKEIAERIKWERAKRRGLKLPDWQPNSIGNA